MYTGIDVYKLSYNYLLWFASYSRKGLVFGPPCIYRGEHGCPPHKENKRTAIGDLVESWPVEEACADPIPPNDSSVTCI